MEKEIVLGIKVDVDTERGTRIGVPQLYQLFESLDIPATFLFSLGPDNTGRAIKRVFRKGFLTKVSRTSIVSTYGVRTLLNGTLLPGPHIAKRHATIMQLGKDKGFEVGIHCYDHIKWQDGVKKMTFLNIEKEFQKALNAFQKVFETPAQTAGAPGWQANEKTLAVYDNADLLYGSDCRGTHPFFPRIGDKTFRTLQIPTTLPTLDELVGRPEYPMEKLTAHYLSLLNTQAPNIMTIHAELEGMKYLTWFTDFLKTLKAQHITMTFKTLEQIAKETLAHKENIPVNEFLQGEVDGRSGKLAVQG